MASLASKSAVTNPWAFPHYRESLRYCWSARCEGLPPRHLFYDAKFYPYSPPSPTSAPVFALVGNHEVIICRPAAAKGERLSCVNVFRDLEPVPEGWSTTSSPILNSCTWNYIEQSVPLLCVAGPSGLIKVLNAITGAISITLVGHGAEVNDLATHPLCPWILASASGDHSIRVWDLRRCSDDGRRACLIICGQGQGHKEPVLTCAWHRLGRYLISGGQDHMVCIWAIPDLTDHCPSSGEECSVLKSSREPKVIHYPHFATSAVHSNYVDCVCFYGDLILSKAAEEDRIVLWIATGFDSSAPPASADSVPATDTPQDTHSGFLRQTAQCAESSKQDPQESPSRPKPSLFTRLLQFRLTSAELFYMRFSLLLPSREYPSLHPTLAIGNTKSKIFFWDLAALEIGLEYTMVRSRDESRLKRAASGNRSKALSSHHGARESPFLNLRAGSSRNSSSPSPSLVMMPTSASSPSRFQAFGQDTSTTRSSPKLLDPPIEGPETWPRPDRRSIHDPFTPIQAHYSHTPNVSFRLLARQAAWSPCGRWCVIAGESGPKDAMAVIYDRWV